MYVFLSFRDPEINLNLGCVITQAQNFEEAIEKTHKLGINPGGEVMGYEIIDPMPDLECMELDRLYSREEMLAMKYKFLHEVKQNSHETDNN